MKAAFRIQYTAIGKALPPPPFFAFLQLCLSPSSPSFPPSLISHSAAMLSHLDCFSRPSVVSLSNFPRTSPPTLFLCTRFPSLPVAVFMPLLICNSFFSLSLTLFPSTPDPSLFPTVRLAAVKDTAHSIISQIKDYTGI